jgi:hypothetical protein
MWNPIFIAKVTHVINIDCILGLTGLYLKSGWVNRLSRPLNRFSSGENRLNRYKNRLNQFFVASVSALSVSPAVCTVSFADCAVSVADFLRSQRRFLRAFTVHTAAKPVLVRWPAAASSFFSSPSFFHSLPVHFLLLPSPSLFLSLSHSHHTPNPFRSIKSLRSLLEICSSRPPPSTPSSLLGFLWLNRQIELLLIFSCFYSIYHHSWLSCVSFQGYYVV